MKLYMKQKVFSWKDRFTIADEQGNVRYTVEGEVFSWGKKLHVYDAGGQEAAFIRQKVWSFLPRYFIEMGGAVRAVIVKDWTFFKPSYHLEGLPWTMSGNFWEHEYNLICNGCTVMRLSKKWWTWGDSYELDIADPPTELMCLCVALAVDCVLASEAAASSGTFG